MPKFKISVSRTETETYFIEAENEKAAMGELIAWGPNLPGIHNESRKTAVTQATDAEFGEYEDEIDSAPTFKRANGAKQEKALDELYPPDQPAECPA